MRRRSSTGNRKLTCFFHASRYRIGSSTRCDNTYLKKEWIVSPTARRIYRISASLSLALFFAIWRVLFEVAVPEPMAAIARLPFFRWRARCWNHAR